MRISVISLFGILMTGVLPLVLGTRAAGQAPSLVGPPARWEARPPLHARPDLASSPSGLSPVQVRHAYGIDQIAGSGAGQVIAIVDAYGSSTIQNDLNIFSDRYGLPRTTVQILYPQGKLRRSNSGWALETSLDVEWAHAMAPGATILLVVAKSASFSDLLGAVDAAVNAGAKQVSMSWGGAEFSSEASYDYHFNRAGATFTASSGDSGAGVEWPAASPYVVSVGGTSLYVDGSGNVLSETAWSGSGGGISAYEPRPAYQNGWQAGNGRGVPDVSYLADPNTGVSVYIGSYNGSSGWITVGGTSAGAPQWAALVALANAGRASSLSATDTPLYGLGASSYSTFYRDITAGNNGYGALPGYDYVTGLGSPLASQIVPTLTSY